jgi:predicted CXXCH cytochrome family protein
MGKPFGKALSLSLLTLLSAVGFVGGALVSGDAVAGIQNTKHNLGSTAPTVATRRNNITNATNEICVFCHTPHNANGTAAGVPLWNKATPAAATFQTYATINSSTLDSAVANVGSVSLACLSCHDGTQALDNMFNTPGSGSLFTTSQNGGGANGATVAQGYTWVAGGGGGVLTVNAEGIFLSGVVANLGKNLANDHPIGVAYCGGPVTGAFTGANCKDAEFKTNTTSLKTTNGNWWVDTEAGNGNGVRDKTDIFLFNRTDVVAGQNVPSVECASCHDVHSENRLFLRMNGGNAGSQVCLACHVK